LALATVDRVTPTQIVVGCQRFRRKDGNIVGGDTWSRCDIRQPEPFLIDKANRQAALSSLRRIVDNTKAIPTETLMAAVALLVPTEGSDA
jgi:hypothetical protein